jgi:hypothetical protein
MVGTNDVTNKNQTEKIQKGDANRVSAGHNHNHAVVTAVFLAGTDTVNITIFNRNIFY